MTTTRPSRCDQRCQARSIRMGSPGSRAGTSCARLPQPGSCHCRRVLSAGTVDDSPVPWLPVAWAATEGSAQMTMVELDPAKLDAFAGKMAGFLNGGAAALMLSIGHRVGLFDAMAQLPPATSE